MRKVINFFKKLNNSINYVNKLNTELSINNDYYILRMLVENRILLKKNTQQKLNVVLIAFEPETWLMFQSIYATFSKSEKINMTVLVIPYAHSTLPEGIYKDDGLREYLDSIDVPYIYGYNEKTNTWLDLFQLRPDYVFYQAPYNGMYPETLKSGYVSRFAQICFIPYATILMKGKIEETVYPIDFFKDSTYLFIENDINKNIITEYFSIKDTLFLEKKIIVTGSTKIENVYTLINDTSLEKNIFTILWLPRWNTREGMCTFFDYYDILLAYVQEHENVRLIFRPHPLTFQNFIHTGEMTLTEVSRVKETFSTQNLILDENPDYVTAFNTANVLVADPTSLIYEFFATQKPIIYTRKIDILNAFGAELEKGCYSVTNAEELKNCLDNLVLKNDRLAKIRSDIIQRYFDKNEKASAQILDILTH